MCSVECVRVCVLILKFDLQSAARILHCRVLDKMINCRAAGIVVLVHIAISHRSHKYNNMATTDRRTTTTFFQGARRIIIIICCSLTARICRMCDGHEMLLLLPPPIPRFRCFQKMRSWIIMMVIICTSKIR